MWGKKRFKRNWNIFRNNSEDLEASFNSDNNRVIYLSPSEDKKYSPNSISKPSLNYEDCSVKILDEKIITTWYFHIELKKWLLECVDKAASERLKLFIKDYIQFWEKINNKEKTIMQELQNYFKDKEQDWKSFVEASGYVEKLKSAWFESFSQKLDSFRILDWKFDKESNDFRWFLGKWENSLSFVYEPDKGLTIWKSQFKVDKNKFEIKFKELFAQDFDTEEDGSSNYVMNFKDKSIVFDDIGKFQWTIGNNPEIILDVIQPILNKYMLKPEVIDLFKDIDKEIISQNL